VLSGACEDLVCPPRSGGVGRSTPRSCDHQNQWGRLHSGFGTTDALRETSGSEALYVLDPPLLEKRSTIHGTTRKARGERAPAGGGGGWIRYSLPRRPGRLPRPRALIQCVWRFAIQVLKSFKKLEESTTNCVSCMRTSCSSMNLINTRVPERYERRGRRQHSPRVPAMVSRKER
jgi:hypothetical protein